MAEAIAARPARAARRGRYFYFGAALVMLATVFAGFSPTFFMRGYVKAAVPPFPLQPYMIVHGCAMTAWCLFFVWQTWLAASGRTVLHRRTGWIGCGLLTAALLTALYMTLNSVHLRVAAGMPTRLLVESRMGIVVFANLTTIPVVAALFTAAVLLRRRREWHGRLMYWTTFLLIGPAFGGGGTRLLEPLIEPYVGIPAGLAVLPVALVALVVHDLRSRQRVHAATIVGALATFLAPLPGVVFALSQTGERALVALG